jgi:hypothetical protein
LDCSAIEEDEEEEEEEEEGGKHVADEARLLMTLYNEAADRCFM